MVNNDNKFEMSLNKSIKLEKQCTLHLKFPFLLDLIQSVINYYNYY